jgi:F0F1-type ATP synthase assembly protein I
MSRGSGEAVAKGILEQVVAVICFVTGVVGAYFARAEGGLAALFLPACVLGWFAFYSASCLFIKHVVPATEASFEAPTAPAAAFLAA